MKNLQGFEDTPSTPVSVVTTRSGRDISTEDILACLPSEAPGLFASDIFEALGLTHFKDEPQRRKVSQMIRSAISAGEVIFGNNMRILRVLPPE